MRAEARRRDGARGCRLVAAHFMPSTNDSADASIKTLHCLSGADPASPSGEELAACFAPSAELLWHERGIAMPDRSWWRETLAFPDRATGWKRYVDQYTVATSIGRMTTPGNWPL